MEIKILRDMSHNDVLLEGIHEADAMMENFELLGVIVRECFPVCAEFFGD